MKKKIKDYTDEELKEYRHQRYLREREKRLEYWKKYYESNKEIIKKKANNRYRAKCGVPPIE